jgi:hypothetical protein
MSLTLSGARARRESLAKTLQAALSSDECRPDLAAWSDVALHCSRLELLDMVASGVAVLSSAFKTGAPFASVLSRAVLGALMHADLFGHAFTDASTAPAVHAPRR